MWCYTFKVLQSACILSPVLPNASFSSLSVLSKVGNVGKLEKSSAGLFSMKFRSNLSIDSFLLMITSCAVLQGLTQRCVG